MPDLIGGSIKWNLDVDKSRLKRGLSEAKRDIEDFGDVAERSGERASNSIASVGSVASSLNKQLRRVALGVTASFAGLLAFGFQQTRAIQNQVAGIQALTGSAKEAGKVIKDMVDFVQGKPFDRLDAIGAAKQLLAMGRTVKDLNRDMELMGRMAIISGGDLRQMSEIFGKVASSGRLTGEEFRQLTQAGIDVGGALSNKLGVSVSEVRELMRAGSIDFKTFREAMEDSLPADVVEKAGNTIDQRLSSLMASFRGLAFEILGVDFSLIEEGGRPLIKTGSLIDKLIDGFEALSKLMRSPDFITAAKNIGTTLADAFDKLGKSILFLIDHKDEIIATAVAFGTFVVLINVATAVLKFVAAWKILIATIAVRGVIGGVITLLGGGLLVGIVAIATAVGLLFLAWNKNFLGIRDITADVFNKVKDIWENTLKPMFEDLKKVVDDSLGFAIRKFDELKDRIAPVVQTLKREVPKIAKVIASISLLFSNPFEFAILFPEDFKKTLSLIFNTTKTVFGALPGLVGDAVMKIKDFMVSEMERIADGWSKGLDDMLIKLADWTVKTKADFDLWFKNTATAISEWATNTLLSVDTWVNDTIDAFFDWGVKTEASIKTSLDDMFLTIETFFDDLPGNFTKWLDKVWEDTKGWWETLGEKSLDETLKGFEKEKGNWIIKIGGFIILVLGLVLAFIVLELIDLGIKIARFMLEGFSSSVTFARDKLIEFFEGVFKLNTDINNTLIEFGKKIVTKIVEGIRAAPGAIMGAISQALPSGNVGNAIRSAFGLPVLERGGIVPGPIGAPVLAVVHGGEEVIPTGGTSKGGIVINQTNIINKETDMEAALREFGWELSIR